MSEITITRHLEYSVTQQDIEMLKEGTKTLYIRLDLLDHNNVVINSLEGNLISEDFSSDANSAVRKTYNCTFFVSDEQWEIGSDKNFWIDRRIAPYLGYQAGTRDDIIWYKTGVFVMDAPSCQFDESTHTISLSCLDLMCTLDGTRGGIIGGDRVGGVMHLVEQGAPIKPALIAIMDEVGITEYDICEFNHEIPYDIEIKVGSTFYQMLEQIINLYSGYEFFFDIDGIFVVQLTPQLKTDYAILSSDIINPLVIRESRTYDWQAIKNFTEVYGQTIEAKFYSEEVAGTINAWTATIEDVTSYEEGDIYALKVPTTNSGTLTININNLGAKRVYEDDGLPITADKLDPDETYCFRYRRSSDDMILLGQYQAYGYYEETSPDCPFSTTNLGYVIGNVITDDAIYSDALCEQRAKYETYIASWMQDAVTLEMMAIPFLCVNQKIGYQNSAGEDFDYIVKSIHREAEQGTMSISLVKFSESYPDMDEVYKYMYGE